MKSVTLSVKGQVVIPADIREHFGLKAGTKIQFLERSGELVLVPINPSLVEKHKGFLNEGKGTLMKVYQEAKKEEFVLEEKKKKWRTKR